MTTVAQRIADWAAVLTVEQIPDAVVSGATRCLIDTIAVAVAGTATPVAERARAIALDTYAPGLSTVLGDTRRLVAGGAALANGTAAHALDFDDNCYAGVVHGSAVVAPAVLAVAEAVGGTGRELLTAFIAGVEAEYAIGRAATMSIYERGWFTSALLGAGGAAVGAARAMRLDARATAHALVLAISGAGGVKACVGSDAKPLLIGQAAQAGVAAALLAQAQATGPLDVFEHPRGFAQLFGNGIFEFSAIDELGRRWCLVKPGIDFKRAPVCLSAAAALDGVLELLAEQGLKGADIERIICEIPPMARANLSYDQPRSIQEAQFSLPFVIACALHFGDVGLQHLDEALINDPQLRLAMQRVEIKLSERWKRDPALAERHPEGAFLTVLASDGRRFEHFSGAGRGTASRPLTEEELAAKFLGCTTPVLGQSASAELLMRLQRLQHLPSARDLL